MTTDVGERSSMGEASSHKFATQVRFVFPPTPLFFLSANLRLHHIRSTLPFIAATFLLRQLPF
jgi:hypothetical protein